MRTGVKAIVILSVPSCEVVRNRYCSIKSSLPTLIYFGNFAVMNMRSPLLCKALHNKGYVKWRLCKVKRAKHYHSIVPDCFTLHKISKNF